MQQLQESKDASEEEVQRLQKMIKDVNAETENCIEMQRDVNEEKGYKIIELEAELSRGDAEDATEEFEKESPSVAAGREEVMGANVACQTGFKVMGAENVSGAG
eukprot:gene18838-25386_t